MSVEKPEDSSIASPRGFEDELREVLDEAERRKADVSQRTSRIGTLIIGIPLIGLLASAGIFLIWYHFSDGGEQPKPIIAARVAEPVPVQQDMEEFREFLPEAMRGAPSVEAAQDDAGKAKHENIVFAMELLNFGRPPSAWNEADDHASGSTVGKQHEKSDD